jgi:hypothetical protein
MLDVRVPCYKNRGKTRGSVVCIAPFLLADSSLAPPSSSLNHGGGEVSKEGDYGAVHVWLDVTRQAPCVGIQEAEWLRSCLLRCGDGTCRSR